MVAWHWCDMICKNLLVLEKSLHFPWLNLWIPLICQYTQSHFPQIMLWSWSKLVHRLLSGNSDRQNMEITLYPAWIIINVLCLYSSLSGSTMGNIPFNKKWPRTHSIHEQVCVFESNTQEMEEYTWVDIYSVIMLAGIMIQYYAYRTCMIHVE